YVHIKLRTLTRHILLLPCTILRFCFFLFFFNDTAPTEIYTLSLHDALPILIAQPPVATLEIPETGFIYGFRVQVVDSAGHPLPRSEEHTSELQSQSNLVCRLLLEKKKKKKK